MEINDNEIYCGIAGFIGLAAFFIWLSFDSATVQMVWTLIRHN